MIDYFPLEKKRLHIELTGQCNLKCVYCFQADWNDKDRIKKELSSKQIFSLIDQGKEIGCKTITITGGEPFLRDNIWQIIEYAKDFDVEILTNSVMLNKEKIIRIGKLYPQLKRIKISIDGLSGHNINRKPSNYKQILENFKYFRDYTKCELIANTIITKYTVFQLKELYALLRNIPINIWRIDLPFLAGRYKKNITKYEVEPRIAVNELKNILIEYFKDKKPFAFEIFNLYKSGMVTEKLFQFDVDIHPCAYSGWRTLCVKPNGDLVFCPSLLAPLANVIDKAGMVDVNHAIKKARGNKFFNIKVKNINKCITCKYLNICGSGCRADALYWSGNLLSEDPVACTYMALMEKIILPVLPKKESDYIKKLIK